jgi:hypothetical protein
MTRIISPSQEKFPAFSPVVALSSSRGKLSRTPLQSSRPTQPAVKTATYRVAVGVKPLAFAGNLRPRRLNN